MSRKHTERRNSILVLAVALALLITPALAQAAPAAQSAPAGGTEYALTYGWYQGQSTFYYSFDNAVPSSDGGVTVTPAPIYVFFYGDDTAVPGQHNVVDVVPGDSGYSDLWQVHKVTVPDDYTPDSVRSYADIVTNGYTVTPVDVFVNCPIVPDGSTLQYSQQGLTQGWNDDSAVYYFDFGLNPVETAPIYVLFYGDDTPVPDQRNIIDDIPGDADYSAFWRVHKVTVPDDYVANTATSLDDITTAGYTVTPTSILVNCPVVRTEGAPEMFDLTSGWYQHGGVEYYSFNNPVPSTEGSPVVTPAPIYVLFYGDGTPVPFQHNIIDVVPGDPGYSDLWQVHKVTVPDAYVADTVRSYAQIADAGYPIDVLDLFVNCPVVPEGSSLADPSDAAYTQGWYQGQTVYYFDFGLNPTETAPIYVLFYGDDTPVPGQDNIVDTVPGEADYSAFWQVHKVTVPDDYVANSATSLSDLQAASYPITPTNILVNCPIVRTEGAPQEYPLTTGWYQDRSTFYYNFDNEVPSSDGGVTVTPAPIYVFFYGDDTAVPGQHNVVDVVPGDPGYSDLWQVHKVTVPDDYVADSVRSYADIVTNGYTVTPVDVFVNCPIVPAGSTLQYSQQGLTQGWDDSSAVYYFDFGLNPVETAPIYVLFYGDDTPVPGQRNIIDDIPGDADYSAFWRVHKVTVPDDYVANTARSLDDITTAGYTITPTSILVNCPVVRTEDAPEMFDLTSGWYQHGNVEYYSFSNPIPTTEGGPTVVPAPIYVLFYGDGTAVPGQHNIIDVVPGDPGYSDLWQVHKVTVPDDYMADTVRSYAQIVDAGYPIDVLDVFVNCPVVPEGSSLSDPSDAPYVQGWYQGQTVFYFDFGMNPTTTAPIYVLFYGDGTPVPGQDNIVDTVPGQPDYSAFWQVHQVTVPDDYVANSATSLSDLQAASYPITPTSILVNCPIVMQPTAVDLVELTAGQASGVSAAVAAGVAGILLLLLAGVALGLRRSSL